MILQLGAPQPLVATHILDGFDCGEAILDEWLKRRAMTNQLSGASRTFVVADQDSHVYGYYAMAAGAVAHQMATSSVRRNMPDPVPLIVARRASSLAHPCCKMPSTELWWFLRTPVSERCWCMRFTSAPRSFTKTTVFSRRRCTR